jgi:hypothetical protein
LLRVGKRNAPSKHFHHEQPPNRRPYDEGPGGSNFRMQGNCAKTSED